MAADTPTAISERFNAGPLIVRYYTMPASVGNGDTMAVPQTRILYVDIGPTTATTVGYTVSGSTITFVSGGNWTGTVAVWSREG